MALTIALAPEKEQALRKEAERRGLSAQDYVTALIEDNLPARANGTMGRPSLEEEERLLDELASGSERLPVLPPEADRREWIYGDHD